MEHIIDKQIDLLEKFKNFPLKSNFHINKSEYIPFDNVFTYNLSQEPAYYESSDLNGTIDEINNISIDNDIIIGNFLQLGNITNYIFLMNEKIFILNSIYFLKLESFLNKMINKSKLFFVSQECKDHFQTDFKNEANFYFQSQESIINFNIEIKKLYDHYFKSCWNDFDSLFLKSFFGYILQRAYAKPIIQNDSQQQRKLNDFIYLRKIHGNVSLFYNKVDEKLNVLKIYGINSQLYTNEKNSYALLGNEFPFTNNCYGEIKQTSSYNYIITDFIDGKTLDYIKEMKLTFEEKIKIIMELALSIEYCHSKRLIIRDLKPNNIIINSNHDAILFDFDDSIIEGADENEIKTCSIREDRFVAPEQKEAIYSYKVDVYSFGLLLYYIVNENDSFDLPEDFFFLQEIADESLVRFPNERSDISKINNLFLINLYLSLHHHIIQDKEGFIGEYLKNMLEIRLNYLQQEKDSFLPQSEILFYFGWIHFECKYFEQNHELSIDYFNKSAELNNSEALYYLGKYYNTIKKDRQKGIEYFKLSSDLQNYKSQSILGNIYINYEPKLINEALKYLYASVKKSYSPANSFLGLLYYQGQHVPRDIEKSIHFLTIAANNRDKYACNFLAILYLNGKYVQKNVNTAIKYYKIAADINYSESQYGLGIIYYHGINVPKDEEKGLYYLNLSASQNNEKAIKYIELVNTIKNISEIISDYKAGRIKDRLDLSKDIRFLTSYAEKGDVRAQFLLGHHYLSRDIKQSIHYYDLASKQEPLSSYNLGVIYYLGEYVKQDINKSIHYFTISADLGNSKSQYIIGKFYYEGKFVKKDVYKAISYFTRSADQNDPYSLHALGFIYSSGNEVPVNINRAIRYFLLAAKQKKYNSYICLALIYNSGVYVKRDVPKAIDYLKLLPDDPASQLVLGKIYLDKKSGYYNVEQGIHCIQFAAINNNREAQYILGELYLKGIFVKQDFNTAFFFLQNASSHGFIPATTLLGLLYSDSRYTNQNDKAIDFYTIAANHNNAQAQYSLGVIYLKGEIVPRDMDKALHYLEMAHNNGNIESRFLLGYLYHTNLFIPRNIKKAISYYKEASNTDYRAATNLGVIYKRGEGIEKNIDEAIYYFNKAIKNGNCMYAMYNLGKIYYYEKGYDDIGLAIDYLQKASDSGFYVADNLLNLIFDSCDDRYKGSMKNESIFSFIDAMESFDYFYYFSDLKISPKSFANETNKKVDINETFYKGFAVE